MDDKVLFFYFVYAITQFFYIRGFWEQRAVLMLGRMLGIPLTRMVTLNSYFPSFIGTVVGWIFLVGAFFFIPWYHPIIAWIIGFVISIVNSSPPPARFEKVLKEMYAKGDTDLCLICMTAQEVLQTKCDIKVSLF